MKRIVLLSNAYKPQYGGLVSYLINISSFIKKYHENVIVEIVVLTNDLNLPAISFDGGIKIHRIFIPKVKSTNAIGYNRLVIKKIEKYLVEKFTKDDYFIARHLLFTPVLAKHFNKHSMYIIPVLIGRMLSYSFSKGEYRKNLFNLFSSYELRKIEKNSLSKLDNVFVLSSSKSREVYDVYKRVVEVLNPAVDTGKFYPDHTMRDDILQSIGRINDREKNILLTVSRLTKEKNTEMIIKSLPKLNPNFILYVVGDGELKNYLSDLAKELNVSDRVIFFGARSDVEIFYKVAKFFVLLSTYEGLGHVYLEAMASGLPIIGLQENPPEVINASSELIKNDVTGWIINSNKDLENKLNDYTWENYSKFSNDCREDAENNFNWNKHINQIFSVLKEGD